MANSKLLFLAGSQRSESVNKKLAKAAYEIAKSKDIDSTFIDLKDFQMPIYDGDYETENSLPENAKKLKDIFCVNDGIFIASPEYNGSFSPLLKNVIDWISRPSQDNEEPLIAYKNKVIALGAASPGGFGGIRGLVPLKMLFGNIGCLVISRQISLSSAFNAFTDDGKLKDSKNHNMLDQVITDLATTASYIHS